MNVSVEHHETRIEDNVAVFHEDQRSEDRRKEPREGYCYISTVGWICRREKIRRKAIDSSH